MQEFSSGELQVRRGCKFSEWSPGTKLEFTSFRRVFFKDFLLYFGDLWCFGFFFFVLGYTWLTGKEVSVAERKPQLNIAVE